MRTIETKVYTFEELPNEVQQKIIKKYYDINVDYDWWDFVYEDAKTIFELIGFTFYEDKQPFFFSGFSSQGDGACIAGACYSYNKGALKSVKSYAPQDIKLHAIVREFQDIQAKTFYTLTASIKHSGHYYHERSMIVDSECEKGSFEYSYFDNAVSSLCKWLYRKLEIEFDYLTSEEAIKETIICNEYEFTIDGKIA